MMTDNFSLVVNVSLNDLYRVRALVPHWLRVFGGKQMAELLLVFDRVPTSGRIAKLHQHAFEMEQIDAALHEATLLDPRLKVLHLQRDAIDEIGLKWFGVKGADRCLAGTPIFPFFWAIEQAVSDVVVKLDSDMIFYGDRIGESVLAAFAENTDLALLSLPRFRNSPSAFSTRAYALMLSRLAHHRPLPGLRQKGLHRALSLIKRRRPFWVPEFVLESLIRSQRLGHAAMERGAGASLHVSLSWWPGLRDFPNWLSDFEAGLCPQKQDRWDFNVAAWENKGDREKFLDSVVD